MSQNNTPKRKPFPLSSLNNLTADEQLCLILVIALQVVTIDDLSNVGFSDRRFTRALKTMKSKGVLDSVRGFILNNKLTWSPEAKINTIPENNEDTRYIDYSILFKSELSYSPLAKMIYFALSTGEKTSTYFRKDLEDILSSNGNTINHNIKKLESLGLISVNKIDGTQSNMVKFLEQKGSSWVKKIFS